MSHNLTDEQRDILAHVVTDPQAWADHALDAMGEEVILDKVKKYKPAYDLAKLQLGIDYKNRAQRDSV